MSKERSLTFLFQLSETKNMSQIKTPRQGVAQKSQLKTDRKGLVGFSSIPAAN